MRIRELVNALRDTTGPVYIWLPTLPGEDRLNVQVVKQGLIENLRYYERVNPHLCDKDFGWELIERPRLTVLRQTTQSSTHQE